MKIQSLFERDIFRPINGVVKADQLDEASIWQELDEFVVTRELDQHLRKFFSAYGDALQNANDPGLAGNIGIWVSGFFGSGKSHLIKVLSYLLRNGTHTHDGQSRRAVDFFQTYEHPTMGGYRQMKPPVKFAKTPSNIRRHPPELGQHTAEMLAEIAATEGQDA